MKLRKFIELGEEKAGSQAKLAKYLNMDSANIRKSKNGIQGMPIPLCIKLANFINVSPMKVISASELITEKKPERREILEKCLVSVAIASFTVGVLLNTIHDKEKSILHNNNIAQVIVSKYTL